MDGAFKFCPISSTAVNIQLISLFDLLVNFTVICEVTVLLQMDLFFLITSVIL